MFKNLWISGDSEFFNLKKKKKDIPTNVGYKQTITKFRNLSYFDW